MGSRDEYVSAMKQAFVSIATRLTIAWAATLSSGVTANPFLSKIIELIANHLFQFLANQSELGAFFLYIDTRVGLQSKDFEDAAFNNWKVQQNGTKDEKKKAETDLWLKFKTFAVLTS
jgi:hypothetical protein